MRTRTCVGCGTADGPEALLRLVVEDGEVAFDLAGKAFGRGAYVHARPSCLAAAPRGLLRSLRPRRPSSGASDVPDLSSLRVTPALLAERLRSASDARIAGLMLAARRLRAVETGAEAALRAMGSSASALAVVAVDAGSIATAQELERAAARGRAMAWSTKIELGALLGVDSVAICAVCHDSIAAQLIAARGTADAAAVLRSEGGRAEGRLAKGEGTECSRRPEGR
jgi:ribosomal protein L7Ae-like RNA K-turn-binding protein